MAPCPGTRGEGSAGPIMQHTPSQEIRAHAAHIVCAAHGPLVRMRSDPPQQSIGKLRQGEGEDGGGRRGRRGRGGGFIQCPSSNAPSTGGGRAIGSERVPGIAEGNTCCTSSRMVTERSGPARGKALGLTSDIACTEDFLQRGWYLIRLGYATAQKLGSDSISTRSKPWSQPHWLRSLLTASAADARRPHV